MLFWTRLQLKAKDPARRKRAAERLGNSRDAHAIDLLLTVLQDENREARAMAAQSLARIGDPRAIEPLVGVLRDPNRGVREAAAKALATLDPEWRETEAARAAVSVHLASLGDQNASVRLRAVAALGEIRASEAVEPLVAVLQDQDKDVRKVAKKALIGIGGPGVIEALVATLPRGGRSVATEVLDRIDPNWMKSEGAKGAVPRLLKLLDDRTSEVRRGTVELLGIIGDTRAFDFVATRLRDSDSKVRTAAVEVLVGMGAPSIDAVVPLLQDPERRVRRFAASALSTLGWRPADETQKVLHACASEDWTRLGELGSAAAETLAAALGDRDPDIRAAAAEQVGKIGGLSAVKPLFSALWDGDERVRYAAKKALRQADPNWMHSEAAKTELPSLVAALADGRGYVREEIAHILGEIRDPGAIEPLMTALVDQEYRVQAAARQALERIDANWPRSERAREALPSLVAALTRGSDEVRKEAANVLGELADRRSVEPLMTLLTDQYRHVRWTAARALGRIGDQQAVDALVKALRDEEEEVKLNAAEALGMIRDARAIEPLVAVLRSSTCRMRRAAAEALEKIGDRSAVAPLVGALVDAEEDVRRSAEKALASIDAHWPQSSGAAEAVPVLAAVLKHKEVVVQRAAEQTLKRIGAAGIAPLAQLLEDPKRTVRQYAAAALSLLGWQPANMEQRAWFAAATDDWAALARLGGAAVEPLMAALEESDDRVRTAAVETFGALRAPEAVDRLARTLKSENAGLRKAGVQALGKMGDSRCVETVMTALSDKDAEVRKAAAEALGRIGHAGCREPLVSTLRDTSANVRKAAANALDLLGWQPADDKQRVLRGLALNTWTELAGMGRVAVDGLIDELRGDNRDLRATALKALTEVADASAIDPLLKHLFSCPGDEGEGVQRILLVLVPCSSLTEVLVRWIVGASSFQHKYRAGWKYDEGYVTLEVSDDAIRSLCGVNHPVTSNVLHLVALKRDISVTMSSGCSNPWQKEISFQQQRNTAAEELKRRGNPSYRPEAYLGTTDTDRERLKKLVAAESERERARRYSLLLSLLQSPQTDLGEDKWTYYRELAEDFKTLEVFRLLANNLAGYHYISPSELDRFEALLTKVGRELPQSKVREALWPVQGPWSNAYSRVLEEIARSKAKHEP